MVELTFFFTLISAYKLQDNYVKQDPMMHLILYELNVQKTLCRENFMSNQSFSAMWTDLF